MKNFRNIIIFMLLAFLALVAFQWYWIQNAISVKKEQFDSRVVEAMNATVAKIEKQEVIFLAKQKIREQEKKRLEALAKPRYIKRIKKKPKKNIPLAQEENSNIAKQENDSLLVVSYQRDSSRWRGIRSPQELAFTQKQASDIFVNKEPMLPNEQIRFLRRMIEDQNRFWNEIERNRRLVMGSNQNNRDIMDILNQELAGQQEAMFNDPFFRGAQLFISPNSPKEEKVEVRKSEDSAKVRKVPIKPKAEEVEYEEVLVAQENSLTKTKNKAEIVKDVFTDILQGNRSIYERVNQQMIDTLLREELINRNIDLPYEYGVKNSDKMIFTSYAVNYNPELADISYNARLFPNDTEQQNQFLYVYFPERDELILGDMNGVFGSSLALLILIGGIFYASVNTMLQQKKLSTIKNDFINNMTHELKTPISTISLAVQVMRDRTVQKNREKTDQYLGIINEENKRLGGQVEKVLQMAQLDQGKVKLNKDFVNLNETIEQVAQHHSMRLEQLGGCISIALEEDLKPIYADEVHITNILYNLIDNAIKYSPEKPQISIKSTLDQGKITIDIKDKGIGMSKDQQTRIFDKFYRATTGNLHDVKGFGLGLSYVKKMMELHHGHIKVKSKPKEGSTFSLLFPIDSV